MPMSEERTLEGPLLFVCTARAQGAISYSSARVVAHPSVPAMWAEERLPMGVGPCSVSGLPPHPTTRNNTSLEPKGGDGGTKGTTEAQAQSGQGRKQHRANRPILKKKKKAQKKKESRPFLSFGKLSLKRQCESLEETDKLPPNTPLAFEKNHTNTKWVLAP